MFGNENKSKWKIEYEDTVYKIYDWNKTLTAYFFPNYELQENTEDEDEKIEELNTTRQNIQGGNILFPMAKLNVLDKEEAIDLDYTILELDQSLQRVKAWKDWISNNYVKFEITGNGVYTSREDREMLSIAVGIGTNIVLGEKEVLVALTPLLDELIKTGLL